MKVFVVMYSTEDSEKYFCCFSKLPTKAQLKKAFMTKYSDTYRWNDVYNYDVKELEVIDP